MIHPGLCDMCRTRVPDLLFHQEECPEVLAYALRPEGPHTLRAYYTLEGTVRWPIIHRVLGHPVPCGPGYGARSGRWYHREGGGLYHPVVMLLQRTRSGWGETRDGTLGSRLFSTLAQAKQAAREQLARDLGELRRARTRLAALTPARRQYRKGDEDKVILERPA